MKQKLNKVDPRFLLGFRLADSLKADQSEATLGALGCKKGRKPIAPLKQQSEK